MISIQNVIDLYATAIADDSAIRTWCRTYYGRDVFVQKGIDGSNPPGQDSFPLVVLGPGSEPSEMGEESAVWSASVAIDWALFDETECQDEGTKEYSGLRRSDELGQLIRTVVKAAASSVSMSRCQYALDPISMHPVYGGTMAVTIEYPNLIGAEMTLT